MLGFEPRTFRMQSERSTTELHPRLSAIAHIIEKILSLIECSVVQSDSDISTNLVSVSTQLLNHKIVLNGLWT